MRVRSNLEPNRVAFWERHPAHPGGGEVFIADDQVHEVGDTAAVRAAIHEGRLVEESGGAENAEQGSGGEKIKPAAPKPAKSKGRR